MFNYYGVTTIGATKSLLEYTKGCAIKGNKLKMWKKIIFYLDNEFS